LRTNLEALATSQGLKSFVVTSAGEREGKTQLVANLGIVFAQAGYEVVLVDANLRRPQLADVLGLPQSMGLSEILTDAVPVKTALQEMA
jgi:succinoglycan biosynthesis transport protein ExoP